MTIRYKTAIGDIRQARTTPDQHCVCMTQPWLLEPHDARDLRPPVRPKSVFAQVRGTRYVWGPYSHIRECAAIAVDSPNDTEDSRMTSSDGQPDPVTSSTEPLTGKWFHPCRTEQPCGCRILQWQGHVIAMVGPGLYLVQLYDFIMGEASDQRLIRTSRMADEGWTFYDTKEDMVFAYEHRYNGEAVMRQHEAHKPSDADAP